MSPERRRRPHRSLLEGESARLRGHRRENSTGPPLTEHYAVGDAREVAIEQVDDGYRLRLTRTKQLVLAQ